MRTKRRVIMTAVLGLLCGLVLSGCSSNVWEEIGDVFRTSSSAEAQDDDKKRIETYVIDVTTFLLKADAVPEVVVSDNATEYTLVSDGRVEFTKSDTGEFVNHDLDSGDKVIERPDSGLVTVMRDD